MIEVLAAFLVGGGSVAGWVVARSMQRGASLKEAAKVVIQGGGGGGPKEPA